MKKKKKYYKWPFDQIKEKKKYYKYSFDQIKETNKDYKESLKDLTSGEYFLLLDEEMYHLIRRTERLKKIKKIFEL